MEKKKSRGKEGKLFSRDVILIYIYILYTRTKVGIFSRAEEQGASFESNSPGVLARFSLRRGPRGWPMRREKWKKNRRLSSLIKERCKRSSGLYGRETRARRGWSWRSSAAVGVCEPESIVYR